MAACCCAPRTRHLSRGLMDGRYWSCVDSHELRLFSGNSSDGSFCRQFADVGAGCSSWRRNRRCATCWEWEGTQRRCDGRQGEDAVADRCRYGALPDDSRPTSVGDMRRVCRLRESCVRGTRSTAQTPPINTHLSNPFKPRTRSYPADSSKYDVSRLYTCSSTFARSASILRVTA